PYVFFFFQAEDGIRDFHVTGVQTCALPICLIVVDKIGRIVMVNISALNLFGESNNSDTNFIGKNLLVLSRDIHLNQAVEEALKRSEERRVGKECRSQWWTDDEKKKKSDNR